MSGKKEFVHLHFHTAYSLLDGACSIKGSVEHAVKLGMPALSITDHGVLYGIADFYNTCNAKGIKPIIGCETYVAPGDMHERKKHGNHPTAYHLVLLAENDVGYYNLLRLISLSHLEGFYYKPRIDKELLSKYSKGLIGLSACLQGEVSYNLVHGSMTDAMRIAGEYEDILGRGNFFVEMEDHGIEEQKTVNRLMPELSKRTGIPLVATNDVHYIRREHAEAHDILLCLQTQSKVDDVKRMRYFGDQFYMKSADEMWKMFGDYPESLTNTLDIAQRCNVQIKLDMSEHHFPVYPLPGDFTDQKQYLIHLGSEGLKKHYGVEDIEAPRDEKEKAVVDRFKYEMGIIERTGFINYFLVVQDFINYAKRNDIPVGPGRGSGAGSILAYALGITGIDPLYYGLIFERFLNPERVSPPDFDIDFCQWRRGEVIEYVKEKYGRENVAQIITFGTMGAKTVIRDIARVLGLPPQEGDRLAKMIPEDPKMTLDKALNESAEFKKACATDPNAQRIMKYAKVLEGLPRQPGIHAAGVVIGEKPLLEILPLSREKNGEPVTQFEKGPMEATGLLKMDFLGLKTLTVIKEALDNIKLSQNIDVDIESIPMDDKETFELLCRGDTVGVFQVESSGMRDLLRRLRPNCIQDLIALIALYRPGPMDMIPDFIDCKHGKKAITYDHPLLESILKETYGIMIYQEQVQFASRALAGFSLGQGDVLRRAMGKKKAEEMVKQRTMFIEGCKKTNNIPETQSGMIFDRIEKFAGYGFNKSHSAAYGVVSYQTAYLKAHYPIEFMAAMLTLEMGNAEKLAVFLREVKDMGWKVLPPDVNHSMLRFSPENGNVRFGLAGIRGVGEGPVKLLIEERKKKGPFTGMIDFCTRLDSKVVNKKVLENLIKCGAFDFTGRARSQLFFGIEFAITRAAAAQKDRQSGQTTMFAMFAESDGNTADANDDELPDSQEHWSEHMQLRNEKELVGFYLSGHPLSRFEWTLNTYALTRVVNASEIQTGKSTRMGGLINDLSIRYTKKGIPRQMAFFTLEGLEGAVEVMVFPDVFDVVQRHLEDERPVMVCGEMENNGTPKMKAAEIYPLSSAPKLFTSKLYITIESECATPENYEKLKSVFKRFRGDIELNICLKFPGGEKVFIDTAGTYNIDPVEDFVHEINHIFGENTIYIDVIQKACLQEPKPRQWGGKKT